MTYRQLIGNGKKITKKTINKTLKPKKERAIKYDEKLQINGSFEDLIKELITPELPLKKK